MPRKGTAASEGTWKSVWLMAGSRCPLACVHSAGRRCIEWYDEMEREAALVDVLVQCLSTQMSAGGFPSRRQRK